MPERESGVNGLDARTLDAPIIHYFLEVQANSTSNTTYLLRLRATQMHEAVAEIAIARGMTRLGPTLAVESTVQCRHLEPQNMHYLTACVVSMGSP